jgi:hypothetical protein
LGPETFVRYEIYLSRSLTPRKFQAGFQLGPDGSQKNEFPNKVQNGTLRSAC